MNSDDLPENWNDDIYEDIKAKPDELGALVVFSRDWTVETIFSQIKQENIDLNPAFQRRNAWDDKRRSRLIESLITGLPVPEIVLAEDPKKKFSYIVIDGKQRLLTIAGFIEPGEYLYWTKPVLKELTVRKDLNTKSFSELSESFPNEHRSLMNTTIRCTVISNFTDNQVLYDIFYRLNTGSVSLSTQELRQVLNRGAFAEYLIKITNQTQPIHKVMGLNEPDRRLRDTEMILRFMSIELFGNKYRSNLSKFLDESMNSISQDWKKYKSVVEKIYTDFNSAIELLIETFGDSRLVGRRYSDEERSNSFNKVLFEAQVYYFMKLMQFKNKKLTQKEKSDFVSGFQKLCKNQNFRESIESSTKDNAKYNLRFKMIRDLVNNVFNVNIIDVPVPAKVSKK